MLHRAYNYSDIVLNANYSELKSRKDADVSLNFGPFKFNSPVCPANMASVIDFSVAKTCSENGFLYFYHRFGDTRAFVRDANQQNFKFISISVGVQVHDRTMLMLLVDQKLRVDMILIDVAHGYSQHVKEMIRDIRFIMPDVFIVAGNTTGDRHSCIELKNWGADAIKVGLSCGAGCSTYDQTGFGTPMFTAACDAGLFSKLPVIIDGGIRGNGDIAKAIVGYLSSGGGYLPMIMAGSLLAACKDSAAKDVCMHGDIISRRYYGSASALNKKNTGQPLIHIEGKSIELLGNGMTILEKYEEIKQSLQSAISYAGGSNLWAFKEVGFYYTK